MIPWNAWYTDDKAAECVRALRRSPRTVIHYALEGEEHYWIELFEAVVHLNKCLSVSIGAGYE